MRGVPRGTIDTLSAGLIHARIPGLRLGDGALAGTRRARVIALDACGATLAPLGSLDGIAAGDVLTGVFYLNTTAPNFLDMIYMTDRPLATLPESVTRPSRQVLEECMEELR